MSFFLTGTGQNTSPGSGTNLTQMQTGMLDPDVKAQTDATRYGLDLKQNRFNQILPLLSGQLGNFNNNLNRIGGTPTINTNPIYNPAQINQQVNAQRAQNDQSTGTQQRLAQQSMAGKGFGANSPLALAMQGQLAGQNLATNAQTEMQTRQNATQQNATHVLGAQTAYENAYADRLKPYLGYQGQIQSALLGALAGLAG